MRCAWHVVAAFLGVISLVSVAPATVIHVPQEYPTIQAGVDAAVDGDTVLVADGTYVGYGNRDIDPGGKAIVVMSKNGAEATIVDCQGTSSDPHRGFLFHCGEDSSTVVRGFTVRNGWAHCGAGMDCYYSSPTIVGNVITGNTTPLCLWYEGGGIYCIESSAIIVGNTITENAAGFGGGVAFSYLSPTIVDNTIADNTAACGGGGVYCFRASGTVARNEIRGNTGGWDGGGLYCDYESSVVIEGNTIVGNVSPRGGGIYCGQCSPVIVYNSLTGNEAVEYGGGICVWSSSPTIEGNAFKGNAAQRGGGIDCLYSFAAIIGNTVIENSADYGGGISCWESTPTIDSNRLARNIAVWDGGGIFCHQSPAIIVRNSILENETDYGGGIFCWDSSPSIRGNTVALNIATSGAGICCWGSSSPAIYGNTVSQNTGILGGGISCWSSSSAVVVNSILWADSASTGPEIYVEEGSSMTVAYSDVCGGWPGQGNVDADPAFVLAESQDYRLLWESPCIDAGYPDSLDPDGTRSDMGAHYFDQDDYLTLYLTPDVLELAPGGELGVTYTVINRWAQPEPFWVLTEAVLPNGDTLNVMGPDSYTLPADLTVQRHLTHRIPPGAAPGVYGYRSRIGVPPSTLYDKDSFEFWVVEP